MGKETKGEGFDASFIIDDSRNLRDMPKEVQRPPGQPEQPIDEGLLPEKEEAPAPVVPGPREETQSSGKPETKEPTRRKRGLPSYREVFVVRNEIKRRQCVYISHEGHALISSLVRVLVESGGEVTVGGYIDKIIHEHLQAYKEEINELYRNSRPDLLK